MATLANQVTLATNPTFSARLAAAAATVALEVLAEAPNTTRGNPLRRTLATGVMSNPTAYQARLAIAVLTDDATFQSQITGTPPVPKVDADADTALLVRLRAMWSLLAGVEPEAQG